MAAVLIVVTPPAIGHGLAFVHELARGLLIVIVILFVFVIVVVFGFVIVIEVDLGLELQLQPWHGAEPQKAGQT